MNGGATLVATCSARVGFRAGDYGEVPTWCNVQLGLRSYVDALGLTRYYCAQHEDAVRARWAPRYVSERADDPLGQVKAAREAREDAFENGRLTFEEPRTVVIEDREGYIVTVDLAE